MKTKRFSALALCLVMLFTLLPAAFAEEAPELPFEEPAEGLFEEILQEPFELGNAYDADIGDNTPVIRDTPDADKAATSTTDTVPYTKPADPSASPDSHQKGPEPRPDAKKPSGDEPGPAPDDDNTPSAGDTPVVGKGDKPVHIANLNPVGKTVGKNEDTIDLNEGIVTTNNGTVTINNGTVSFNNGTVYNNSSSIGRNNSIVEKNFGVIQDNFGTVATNNDTVEMNANNGIITENLGSVEMNNGTITTNSGSVIENNGTVTTNDDHVGTNYEKVRVNGEGGTVDINNGTVTDNYGIVKLNFGTVAINWPNGTVYLEGDGTVGENYGNVFTRPPIQMGGEPSADDELADAEVVVLNGAKWIRVTKYDVIMSGLLSYLSEAEQEEFWLNRGYASAILEASENGTVALDLTSGIDRLQGAVLQAMLARPDVTVKLLLPHGRTATISSAAAAQYAERDIVLLTSLIG